MNAREAISPMVHDVRITEVRPEVTAVVRGITTLGDLSVIIPRLLDQVYAFLSDTGIRQAGHNIVVYLDDEVNIEAGVIVSEAFEGPGEVVRSRTSGGTAATSTHCGAL
jgi:effector-binding domain-containing protein